MAAIDQLKFVPGPDGRWAYSPTEAASRLGIGRTSLYKLINEGKLRTVTVGARRLVPAQSLHDLLNDPGEGN